MALEHTIRFATAEDFETVYHFINELENEVLDKEKQHTIFTRNCNNPHIIYLLAFTPEKPLGFLSCHVQDLLHHAGAIGEIQELFVIEKARSLGIGKMLIDELKSIAQIRHIEQLEVTSSFKRESAHRFYLREGFDFTHKKFVLKLKTNQ